MAAKILRPKALFGFVLAMLISLTTANLAFTYVYGFTTSLNHSLSGLGGGIVILQQGAKSIHTSRVPLSLAKSLRMLPGVEAHAVTLTPITLAGKPIVFRGVETFNDYAHKIIQGSLPTEEGSWTLLGEKAYRRLDLEMGDTVVVGSPSAPNIVTLRIAGVYRLGDLRDYEALVPYHIGVELAGIPDGLASAIQVDGIERGELESLVKDLYMLEIEHDAGEGRIVVLNSLNTPVASFAMKHPGSEVLQLPFGHYTMVYHESYLTANLTNILLTENQTLTLRSPDKDIFKLKVVAPETQPPTLQLENSSLIQGKWIGNVWFFEAPRGLHTIKLSEASYPVALIGDTTFNPQAVEEEATRVEICVQWQDGADVTDYLISIRETDGVLVASIREFTSSVTLNLPEGKYEAEVSKPPYLAKVEFRIPEQKSVMVSLPRISNPSRITPRFFQQLKAVSPTDASATTLTSLIGLTTASLTSLMTTLTVLSIIAVFTVQKGLHTSAQDNLRVLWALGAGKREILRMIWFRILGLNLALGLGATCLALAIHECLSSDLLFTILGYGLQAPPSLTLAYSLTLSIGSWLLSATKLTPGMDTAPRDGASATD